MNKIFLLSEKQFLILNTVHGSYTAEAAKVSDVTFSHAVLCVNEFKRLGWVTSERAGRKNVLRLTAIGLRVRDLYRELVDLTTK